MRHGFAKSYFGISNFISPNITNPNFLNSDGSLQQFERSGFLSPAINIGATHFWGFADFYISISTVDLKFGSDDVSNGYSLGTFTGLRLYPISIQKNSIRPYLGFKFSPFSYKQTNELDQDFKHTSVKSTFDFGVGIQLEDFYFTMEYGKVVNPSFDTFLSRTVVSTDQFPSRLFQIGINYTIETTKIADAEINKASNKLFSSSNKKGFFIAAGPSSAFPTTTSSYITELYPFLDDRSFPAIFPDVALGYHFTKTDLITALSYRPIKQNRISYGFEQEINRTSLILEAYKFLMDYNGFVPYLGVGVSYENISLSEIDNEIEITQLRETKLSAAFVFGWDIRPSVKGDWWILRTNLRYYPFLKINYQDKNLSLQHLEFNFIQFVLYPERLKSARNLKL